MTSRVPAQKPAKLPGIESGQVVNFSGGPNFRDVTSELASDETYSSYNCTYDERGGVSSRLGYTKRNLTPLASAPIVNEFYSSLLGGFVTQCGPSLYFADNTTARKTFSTSDCVTFADFAGKVIAGHPVDGLWSSPDGITWTQITSANAPTTANCIAVWMSKLFVGMADGTVHWSAASDPTTWAATDFNAVWTKDKQPIVALAIGSGQDIQGRPGLLVFKNDSVYRMNDSGTGSYTVLDTSYGAAGPKAVVGVGARVIWIGKGGVWWFREDQAQPVNASDLLRPIWRPDELSYAHQAGWCAGRRLNRAYFSLSSAGSSVNDLALEYHPDEGWMAPRSDAMACYSMSKGNNALTYGGSPSVNGQVYQLDNGGTDDGAAISGWVQTRWVAPNGLFQSQVWKIRILGRGVGSMTVRKDYQDSAGISYSFNLSPAGAKWGSFDWGDGSLWTATTLEHSAEFAGIGSCRQFSLLFSFTSSTTVQGRSLFGNFTSPSYGSFGLYAADYLFVPLGSS